MTMTSYKSVFAAIAAVVLVTACAKKEEEPAADVSLEVTTQEAPAPVEAAPMDPAASDANSTDAEQSGGDKVSDPEPPPAGS